LLFLPLFDFELVDFFVVLADEVLPDFLLEALFFELAVFFDFDADCVWPLDVCAKASGAAAATKIARVTATTTFLSIKTPKFGHNRYL